MAYQVYGRQNRSPFNRSWSDFFRPEPDDTSSESKSTGYTVFGKLKRPRAVQPGSLAVSVSLHLLLFLMVIGVTHRQQQLAKERPKDTQAAPVLFYVPPPPPRPPPPPAELFVPPPPLPPGAETDRPQAVAPSDQSPKTEEATKPPSPDQPKAPEAQKKELASAQPAPSATEVKPPSNTEESASKRDLVSEARRLFGQKTSTGDSSGTGEPWSPTFGQKRNCPTEEEIRDSGSTLTTMTGRVFADRRGTPLANVHLQILGTPYDAFTDSRGVYVLRFAASLVANCRTQTVRVSAAGYPVPDLMMGLFPGTRDIYLPGR